MRGHELASEDDGCGRPRGGSGGAGGATGQTGAAERTATARPRVAGHPDDRVWAGLGNAINARTQRRKVAAAGRDHPRRAARTGERAAAQAALAALEALLRAERLTDRDHGLFGSVGSWGPVLGRRVNVWPGGTRDKPVHVGP